ncbi:hypothetical protein J2S00_002390 [Caldalkalibacillus uzonensis]|uniref:Anti-sigma-W factor RsiW n=1 Tax=Caldalkalibacillus uzonensis TaxID=353224 RepID=A0ABU0CX13_9BACI|nr:hypothetical protein [Caldalkalibacillus uzonensis]
MIQLRLDGDLSEDEQQQLEHHLTHCPNCEATFQRYKALHEQLEQLPKVTPPHSIVDQLDFAQLNEKENAEGERNIIFRSFSSKKIIWVCGGLAALILVVFSLLSDGGVSPDLAEDDAGTMESASVEEARPLTVSDEDKPAGDQGVFFLLGERERIYSPDQTYSAYIGPDNEDIRIDKRIDGEDQPYYISSNPVSSAWTIEEMEWVSDHELYYVLYHEERDEQQYWIFNADNREEIRLEGPYPEYQPEESEEQ